MNPRVANKSFFIVYRDSHCFPSISKAAWQSSLHLTTSISEGFVLFDSFNQFVRCCPQNVHPFHGKFHHLSWLMRWQNFMCDEKCVSYCQCDKSSQKLELLIATKNTNIFLNTLLYSDFVFHEICYIQFYKKHCVCALFRLSIPGKNEITSIIVQTIFMVIKTYLLRWLNILPLFIRLLG